MTRALAPFALALLLASPALAQEPLPPEPEPEEEEFRFDLFGLEDLRDKAERALEELRDRLGPLLDDLGKRVEDLRGYGPPEVLPNGDILIPKLDEDEVPESTGPEDQADDPPTIDL